MKQKAHNKVVNFIWGIADDVLRDVFVRGKYRDIILPFTVIRRLDVLLEKSKEKVLENDQFLIDNKIDDKSALNRFSGYPFYNTSRFTMGKNGPTEAKFKYVSLMSDPENIDSNLEEYLDGFGPNVQEIISKFKIRNQLQTMQEAGITFALIEKLVSNEINLGPNDVTNSKGEKLLGLSNLGMGYVFEELIRKFNEENNEEAGEHFTPREIIRLMTHVVFEPLKGQIKEHARYSIYDPACGSGGMLTEAEHFAEEITNNKSKFVLYGQEVNPETYAICTSDMLIKNENPENIAYGSTLGNDGFMGKEFDFMLSNPPYGKSWKIDIDAIQDGKKILDPRFSVGTPRSSDGQLLFLANMAYKMKNNTDLGSRVASVHNGSALFTGDAGSGESNIRKWLIENDWVDCIIGLPKNMFYNTGISTYIFILSNRKLEHRKGKVQLIDATEIYKKKRKSLGNKSNELTKDHIRQITDIYLNFEATEKSKIFKNSDFGYQKIIIDRPLRLSCQFTQEKVDGLRFHNALQDEMEYIYEQFGEDVYTDIKQHKESLLKYWEANEIKVSPANKNKLFDVKYWKVQKGIMDAAQKLFNHFGDTVSNDFNIYKGELDKSIKKLKISISPSEKKQIINAISWKNEEAEPIVKKKEKDGTIIYEPDSDLRDSENVPLLEDIDIYFKSEVLPHVSDAWIDYSKTTIGYEISFTKYFYKYKPLRSLERITKDLIALENESDGLIKNILT
ncbi:N-6 DNA methylase [Polaribacter vadi]|uniref:site-specific DNA-methyltransferase (adenine-specific) n=1 Tax=Polaribacter vadi TaxID=1774273 RepID=A0A1B8TX42_9FLAO|nr:class I SAM-dependent DNA methyltransferase [Polaribacter vadi]AOW16868.1 N-6 DNA methylase [Polaribacter vadi]OBY64223.1 N-6 DNA methylase [Polaribacter vadi]